ncbi:MAG TPA: hypothetical protein VFP65_24300 [Anaeromyxobacteraceae bacterium]|nr:hypothetical protein [Anaeromyxobacteraceae bacterium]
MRDPRLRPFRGAAAVLAATLLLQAASAAALFALKLGPGAARVREFYLGSEARFTAAKSLSGLLEVALPHLVAIPLAIFAVAHLVGFVGAIRRRPFAVLVGVTFASALAGILASFGVRYLAPSLAWAKIASFCVFEAALLGWAGLLAWTFFLPARLTASARDPAATPPPGMASGARGCPP